MGYSRVTGEFGKGYEAPDLLNTPTIFNGTEVKKTILCLSILSVCLPTIAQQALPAGIVPLEGEMILRLTPKHASRCTTKKNEKKPGEFFGTRSTTMGTSEIFEEAQGKLKFQIIIGDALSYIRVTADVKPDRSGLSLTTPEFQTNMEVPEKDRQQFEAMKQIFAKLPEMGTFGIGKPLRQGIVVQDIEIACKIFPGSSGSEKSSGGYRVLGTTSEWGRESIVFGGDQAVSCRMPGTLWHMQTKGWLAVDRLSGLVARSSTWTSLKVDGQSGISESTDDMECAVTGEVISTAKGKTPPLENSSTPGSIEHRLLELKLLLDKGLITNEQYEQKRTEILKAL